MKQKIDKAIELLYRYFIILITAFGLYPIAVINFPKQGDKVKAFYRFGEMTIDAAKKYCCCSGLK